MIFTSISVICLFSYIFYVYYFLYYYDKQHDKGNLKRKNLTGLRVPVD